MLSVATSSIVSEKALVKYPKVIKNRDKNPVNSLCLKEKSRIKDQATTGIFLKNEAIILDIIFVTILIPVVFEPIIDKNSANIAETIVELMESKIVFIAESKITGKYWTEFLVGINFWNSQIIPDGIEKKAVPFLKPAKTAEIM